MSDYVWLLQRGMLAGNNLWPDFIANLPTDKPGTEEEGARERAMNSALRDGRLISESDIPKSLISTYPDSKIKLDREFFESGFFIAVSGRIHELIKGFNYGGGGFHPALPYRKGKLKKPLGEPFYLMNFAGKKSALLPEASNQLYHNKSLDTYSALDLKDNDVVVSKAALRGPDVWIDEKMNSIDIFLSGPLGDTIKAAKPKSRIYMSKCRVQ